MLDFIGNIIVGLLASWALAFVTSVVTGFIVMILIGVLHSQAPQIPAFGFVASFLIALIGSVIVADGANS